MKLKIFLALLIGLFSLPLFAQVGDTGAPIADFETRLVCWDNEGTDVTLVQVTLYVVGDNDGPANVAYHTLEGIGVPGVLATNVTPGVCGSGEGGQPIATNDYEIQELCDDGTVFYRLVKITADVVTEIGDYTLAWTSYTVAGTVSATPCYTTINASPIRITGQEPSDVTVVAGKQSIVVCATGVQDALIIIAGANPGTKIKPGECWSYTAYLDPVTGVYNRTPSVYVEGTYTVTYVD